MPRSKLSIARGAMHDARHAENTLRTNYREAKRKAEEFKREAMVLCAEKEQWIYERAELKRQIEALSEPYDMSQVIRLTHNKAKHVIKQNGYAVTGFVLTHEDGRKCLVDMSAVRWFHDKDGRAFFEMMHPDAKRAAPVAPAGWVLVPDASNMTDEQAEAIAERANCCGGIAYDIYRALLEASPKAPG